MKTNKRLFTLVTLVIIGLMVFVLDTGAMAADGDLDTSFGGGGMVTTDVGNNYDWGKALAIQSDGKILVAGYAHDINWDFAMARYNNDGSLDITFDGDGIVATDLAGSDYAQSVVIQPDGKIVVAGFSDNNTNDGENVSAVARYNTDGSLDTTFDGDGMVTTNFGDSATAYAVAVQPDGKIVVAGAAMVGSGYDFGLARYNSDGSLDTSFDDDGLVTTDFGYGNDHGSAVAIQPDGKIVVAGDAMVGSGHDFVVARYNSDGSLDTSFDNDGLVTTDFGYGNDYGSAVAIQSDGKIVVTGRSGNTSGYDLAVARYNNDGSLDASFNDDGLATTDFGGTGCSNDVMIQPDGKIVVAGYYFNNGSDYDFAVARYNNDGSLDASFDNDGLVTTDFGGSGWDTASAIAIQPDGKIVVAGSGYSENSDSEVIEFAVARYEGTFAAPPPIWTVMIYLDGDNNLEANTIQDFLEMASVGSNDNLNILVQFDRISGYVATFDDWTTTKRFRVTAGMTPTAGNALEDIGEANMGDPATLQDFIDWGTSNYPADNYAVVLWDHGGGWRAEQDEYKAVCWDNTNGNDVLYMKEVQSAFNSASTDVDLIGFDACLMGMVEVAYELRNTGASVMVGSEEVEPTDGWPYDLLLGDLSANTAMTPAQFGSVIVDRYYESYGDSLTQAAVDLSQMGDLGTAVDTLADTLISSWDTDQAAVQIAAQAVKDTIDTAIINEQHGAAWRGAHGLAIYFPADSGSFDSEYDGRIIDFPADTDWEEFLDEYYLSMDGSWVYNAREESQVFNYPEHIDLYDFCDYLITTACETGYSYEEVAYGFEDISATGTDLSLDLDGYATFAIPFTFNFYCRDYDAVSVNANGVVYFKNWYIRSSYANVSIPGNTDFGTFIAGMWNDLDPSASGAVYYEIRGEAPERRLIVQWDSVPYLGFGGDVTFQIVLYEGSNQILFQYEDVVFGDSAYDYGAAATVGVQERSAAGVAGVQYSYNSASLSNGLAILFSPEDIDNIPNLINWNNNLVADFGDNGMWYHDGTSWSWMTNKGHVGQMVVWNGKLVVDFGTDYGIHYYDGSWHWMSNKGDVARMIAWNNGATEKLVVDFGGGRRIYTYDGSWHWFNNKDNVAALTVWQNRLIVDFGNGRGVYNNDGTWHWMSNKDDIAKMVVWDNGGTERLVVDFGGGRRVYTYNGSWQWLINKDNVNAMDVWDNRLVVDFGAGRGIYNYDSSWHWMSNKDDTARMVTWNDGTDKLAVDFGADRSMYYYDGAWHWMKNAADVPEMVPWGTLLAVDFGSGVGVYNYNGSWHLMKSWSTAD